VIATLVKAGADPKARGGISFQDYQQKNISFMVENYTFAIPNTNHNVGKTALMYAAEYNQNPEVITTLLKAGADLEAQDKTGMTALMYAAAANPIPEVITVLLKAGADVNAQIKTQFVYIKGMTALMHAASCNQNPDVITTLLKAGANAKAKDKNGKTALYYAKNNRKLKGTAALRQLQKVSQ
jgi:ankyrin repeat protein